MLMFRALAPRQNESLKANAGMKLRNVCFLTSLKWNLEMLVQQTLPTADWWEVKHTLHFISH